MIELVSWNVNRRSVWDALMADAHCDLALLQEAPRPPSGVLADCVPPPTGDWSTTHWKSELRTCVALFSERVTLVPRALRDPREDNFSALGVSRRGTLAVADVQREEEFLFTVVLAYAAWESPPGRDDLIYADGSAHRLLSDLSGLVTGSRRERVIVAGDFNIFFGYGEHGDEYFAARYQSVFDRAAAMGLHLVGPQARSERQAAPWPDELPTGSLNVPTFHHSKQSRQTATPANWTSSSQRQIWRRGPRCVLSTALTNGARATTAALPFAWTCSRWHRCRGTTYVTSPRSVWHVFRRGCQCRCTRSDVVRASAPHHTPCSEPGSVRQDALAQRHGWSSPRK